ncbi:hypothetical protein [Aquabacterium humicola]|uniref:hypothetical protein n=1 Tax=Aquabacterium humicola TaxID=3237377 RepID=UPI002542C23B|nr:hypothetical protein [Rubrivivax pictus]
MTRKHRRTTDERSYAAAEDTLTAEGGRPSALPPELTMSEFGIGFDGRQYVYNGYRYDRLADAAAYAGLIRSRPTQLDAGGSFTLGVRSDAPSDAQRSLMAALSIGFDGRAYHFDGFRYDNLADAVSYAKLTRPIGDRA